MKQETDRRFSQHPQAVMEPSDLQKMIEDNVKIGEDIQEAHDLEEVMTGDVGYMSAARCSERRVLQLIERSLWMPLNRVTMLWHAEMRGRIAERFRLTREITGLRTLRDKISFKKTTKEQAIDNLSRTLEKQKKERK